LIVSLSNLWKCQQRYSHDADTVTFVMMGWTQLVSQNLRQTSL